MKNESIREYYRSTPRESSIKRIRRIVSQNLQKAKQLTATTSTSETAMSQTIVDNRMRYAKKCSPEERKSANLARQHVLTKIVQAPMPMLISQGKPTPHRLSQNRTNLRKSAPGSDSGNRRRPTRRTRRCVARL